MSPGSVVKTVQAIVRAYPFHVVAVDGYAAHIIGCDSGIGSVVNGKSCAVKFVEPAELCADPGISGEVETDALDGVVGDAAVHGGV